MRGLQSRGKRASGPRTSPYELPLGANATWSAAMLSVVVCAHLPLTRFHSRSVLSVEVESAKRPLGCTETLFTCFLQQHKVVVCCLLAVAPLPWVARLMQRSTLVASQGL